MLGTREWSSCPDSRLEVIQEELTANNQQLKEVEQALEQEPSSPYLLKKYERLSRREELLLEERRLWAGAALQSHSWQAGLQAAPGVKALLSRLVLAAAPQAEGPDFPAIQRALATANIPRPAAEAPNGSRKYNTRRAAQPSPDKAQLMLLADAADASDDPEPSSKVARHQRKRKLAAAPAAEASQLPQQQPKRRALGARFKPFHVAKTANDNSEGSEEGGSPPVEVPVVMSLEDRLAEYARRILAGSEANLGSDFQPSTSAELVASDSSRESRDQAPVAREADPLRPQATARLQASADDAREASKRAAPASKGLPAAAAGANGEAAASKLQADGTQVPASSTEEMHAAPQAHLRGVSLRADLPGFTRVELNRMTAPVGPSDGPSEPRVHERQQSHMVDAS